MPLQLHINRARAGGEGDVIVLPLFLPLAASRDTEQKPYSVWTRCPSVRRSIQSLVINRKNKVAAAAAARQQTKRRQHLIKV